MLPEKRLLLLRLFQQHACLLLLNNKSFIKLRNKPGLSKNQERPGFAIRLNCFAIRLNCFAIRLNCFA
jgi:hypothetical protein